ncbi:hypothetical protein GN244_ATG16665 [Phytophthora infestans]|uniref:Uncharacterized protein n=1 Tax=Phytophthora infestans TaxID=4787 RepID=A0A833RRL0_PHYIN|nr:hypothetical protein GN244_ATG16665 [Phytophthora infestans]KAF4131050.1 hypothetical protein GN958_ATG19757 [Phytophthora infestans]
MGMVSSVMEPVKVVTRRVLLVVVFTGRVYMVMMPDNLGRWMVGNIFFMVTRLVSAMEFVTAPPPL